MSLSKKYLNKSFTQHWNEGSITRYGEVYFPNGKLCHRFFETSLSMTDVKNAIKESLSLSDTVVYITLPATNTTFMQDWEINALSIDSSMILVVAEGNFSTVRVVSIRPNRGKICSQLLTIFNNIMYACKRL